jgi:putative ABC transport system substrate-binding protein
MNGHGRHDTERRSAARDRRSPLAAGVALTAAALLDPRGAAAQSARVRRIGWLSFSGTAEPRSTLIAALREFGWTEGGNLAIDARHADGRPEKLAEAAAELASGKVELIVAVAPSAIRAAMQATTELPIVMGWWGGPDLVAAGIIASYARPGGNVTGVDMLLSALDAKRLDVLRQAVPQATKFAVLIHSRQMFEPQLPAVRDVAAKAGLTLEIVDTGESGTGYADAFDRIVRSGCQAVLVMSSPFFGRQRKLIIEQAARVRVPAIYSDPRHAAEGGLMSYGTSLEGLDRQVARQIDRILRGEKPGEMPVEQPSRYELVINLAVARSIGLVIPRALVLQADQVID